MYLPDQSLIAADHFIDEISASVRIENHPPSTENTWRLSTQAVKQLQEKWLYHSDNTGSLSPFFKASWAAVLVLPTLSEEKSG